MKYLGFVVSISLFSLTCFHSFGQRIIQEYGEVKDDSVRIGRGEDDFLKYIQKGYTLALPDLAKEISGVIVFLEDSGYDGKNNSAKQLYPHVNASGLAVLSVSTEIPLDFFFSNKSPAQIYDLIEKVFVKHNLPNKEIFFIGVGLSGHRTLRYIEFVKKHEFDFTLNIVGIVICDAPLDWVRQWHEGKRDVRINFDEGAVWEGSFSTYLLEKNLKGTPKDTLENYLGFSPYSYFDVGGRHIQYFKDYAFRVYAEPAMEFWLENKRKTPFDNNTPDMVGLIAQLKLAGNDKSELVLFNPGDNQSEKKNPNYTWKAVDKDELIDWIKRQMN